MSRDLPTGTVTFLFTDIEGSTRLLRDLCERYAQLLADQQEILRKLVREGGGEEVDSQGEGMFIVFRRAHDAVSTAVACQRAMAAHAWPDGRSVRIRMGIHTGEPARTETGYVGIDVHRAARICAAGHGGQILLSPTTRELLADDLPQGITVRDMGMHGLKDLAQPEHLFQLLVPELPSEFPPLRTLDTQPNNLPRQLTSFVGRERELAEIERVFADAPLLTLTGVGGSGKTRLALQAAAAMLGRFRDGVWVVELASLSDPGLVTQAVATSLGIREVKGRTLLDSLRDYLATKQLLLYLDNCEHLLGACAELADALLRASPGLRVLATSREGLGIGGERIYSVPSLLGSDAARLFVERARFHRPQFEPTPGDVAVVTQICERLDGIPLAIELAAARVRALSVAELAAKLGDRFRILTGGSRTALPRHQTLRAAIDWSYELLSERERSVLRSASVFAGGFSLDAAEAACSGPHIAADDVLALLARLVDKSLLNATDTDGDTRYRMLETVREFAREKLVESGDEAAVRARHLEFFLRLAEAAEPQLETKDQLEWLERLERERDNIRAALDWSIGLEPAEPALRLTSALRLFWHVRGPWSEAMERFERALRRADAAGPAIQAKVKMGTAYIGDQLGQDRGRARRLCGEALELYRQVGDKWGTARVLLYLGMIRPEHEGSERAESQFEEALALARETGDQVHASRVLANLAGLALARGEGARAAMLMRESLVAARASGDRWVLTNALSFMSIGERLAHNYASARAFSEECLTLAVELGHKMFIGGSLLGLAEVASAQGDSDRAAHLLGAAERVVDLMGGPGAGVGVRPDASPACATARAALGEGAFQSALAAGRGLTLEQAVAYALTREPGYHDTAL